MEKYAIAALHAVVDLLGAISRAISRPGDELASLARGRRGQKDGEREDRAAVAVDETHQAAAGGVGVEFDTANAELGRRHSSLWKVFLRSHGRVSRAAANARVESESRDEGKACDAHGPQPHRAQPLDQSMSHASSSVVGAGTLARERAIASQFLRRS